MLATIEPARLRVLVVDDDFDTVDSMASLLRLTGYEVETASSGAQAIATVATFRPDVTMLDLAMPGMDGYETARQIQRLVVPRPPVLIAVTGYGDTQSKRRSAEAGFDLHLLKPVEISVLQEMRLLVGEKGRLAERVKQQRQRQQEAILFFARSYIQTCFASLQVARKTERDDTRARCLSRARRICHRLTTWAERNPQVAHARDDLEQLIRQLPR